MSPKHGLDERSTRCCSPRHAAKRTTAHARLLQRHMLFAALIMLLALGIVSVSFSYFSEEYMLPSDSGSLIFQVRTAAAKRDLADTGVNVDSADSAADVDLIDSGANADLIDSGANADLAQSGATSTTLYYAITSSDLGSYTVKCNTNHKGNGDDWHSYTMTDTTRTQTINSTVYQVYTCTFTDSYDGLGCIQFQLYDGNTWKSQDQPFGTKVWTSPSTYNGKLWVKGGSSWLTYSPDPLLTKLSAPTLKYNNATTTPVDLRDGQTASLSWADVSNASSYTIYKDDVQVATGVTSPYQVSETGSYTVKAIGNGTTYSDSDASNSIRINFKKYYVLGLKSEYTWSCTDTGNQKNLLTYNSSTQLYEGTFNLYQGSATYGGTNQANANDTGFKVYEAATNTYYGSSSGYTINGMSYNNTTLSTGGKNICLKTKDLSDVTSSAVPYKFTFNPSNNKVTVYYPMKVTYNANGHGTAPSSAVVAYGAKVTAPTPAPTADYYDFIGWYKESGCTNEWDFSNDTVTADTALYAKWTPTTYTITLNKNGGTTSFNTTSYTIESSTITLPAATGTNAITKDGHDFLGWYESEQFSGTVATSIPQGSHGNKTYWAKWRARTPIIDTFTINSSSSASLSVNGTTTLRATYRYPSGSNRVTFSAAESGIVTISNYNTTTSTNAEGQTVYTTTATLTALKPRSTSLTITASLTGAEATKTVTMTVAAPTISDSSAITLYPDQSNVSKSVTASPTPVWIKYYAVDSSHNADTSVFTVGENNGTLNPNYTAPAASPYTAPVSKLLQIKVKYNDSYTAEFYRTVNLTDRAMYTLGLKNDYTWNVDSNNKMGYNWYTSKYVIHRWLYANSDTTYGGTSSTTPNDTGFKLYDSSDSQNPYYGVQNDYRFNGMDYNTTVLTNGTYNNNQGGKNLRLTIRNLGVDKLPYRFEFDYTSKRITIYYPRKVEFNLQGHGSAIAFVPVPDSEIVPAESVPDDPEETGWVFGGWYKEAGCTNQWNFATDIVTADTNLYAKWTAKTSALTFNKNTEATVTYQTASGGSASGFSTGLVATFGSAMPTSGNTGGVNIPIRTGYTFLGFYDAASGGTKYYHANGTGAVSTWDKDITTGTTLYAHWQAKQSTLTFNKNNIDTDGSTLVGTPSGTITASAKATYDAAMPSYTGTLTLTGYTFLGFYDAASGGTKYYNADGSSAHVWDKDTTAGTTLYAHWQIKTPTVTLTPVYRSGSTTYAANNSITPALLTAAYLSTTDTLNVSNSFTSNGIKYYSAVTLTAGSLSGYTFNGIYAAATGSGTRLDTSGTYSIAHMGASNVTYYARYTKNLGVTLNVTYDKPFNNHASTASTFTLTATPDGGVGTYRYTYSYSTDNGTTWTAIASNVTSATQTFNPVLSGDYLFKVTVKDGASATASTQSSAYTVTKDTSVVYTVTSQAGAGSSGTATVTCKGVDYTVSSAGTEYAIEAAAGGPDGIYGGDKLKVTVARSSTHYIESITVTMGGTTTIYSQTLNRNGDITINPSDFSNLSAGVSGNIVITYVVKPKPTVTIPAVTAGTQSLVYTSEGASVTQTSNGTYSVDYNTQVAYTVTPDADHYLVSLASSQGSISNSPVPPSASAVTGSITVTSGDYTLTPTFAENPVVNVIQPEFGSIWVTDSSGNYYLNGDSVRYNTQLKVHVAKNVPEAHNYSSDVYYTISSVSATYGDATHSLSNPITGTQSESVYTHSISANTTYSAVITHFNVNTNPTQASMEALLSTPVPIGYRRIFYTDNDNYAGANGDSLYVHYSNESGDYWVLKDDPEHEGEYLDIDSVQMTYLFTNAISSGQKIYYATIPAAATYVSFHNHTPDPDTAEPTGVDGVNCYEATSHTDSYALNASYSAFYKNDSDLTQVYWRCYYADIRTYSHTYNETSEEYDVVTVDALQQQAATGKGRAVMFNFLHDAPYSASYLEGTLVAGDDVSISFVNGGVRITPTELDQGFSLVKIKSKASDVEKFYLIRINPVELKSFKQLQKLFKSDSVTSLTLQMAAKGAELTYSFLYSMTNASNSAFTLLDSSSNDPTSIITQIDTVVSNIHDITCSLTLNYSSYHFRGMVYFMAMIEDAGFDNQTDSKIQHTVFDLDSGTADGVLYFKNTTNLSLQDDLHTNVVARFTTGDGSYVWLTMQPLNDSDSELVRVSIPSGATKVQFYLMYEDKYSADMSIVDTLDAGSSPVYYFAKSADLTFTPGRMYRVSTLYSSSLSGTFAYFRQ